MGKKSNPWSIGMLTLFPEMFPGPLGFSLAGRALDEKLWNLNIYDIRQFCEKSADVDSSPFGGGNGMVMRVDVIDRVLSAVTKDSNFAQLPVVYMTPRGEPLTQEKVKMFSQEVKVFFPRIPGVFFQDVKVFSQEVKVFFQKVKVIYQDVKVFFPRSQGVFPKKSR